MARKSQIKGKRLGKAAQHEPGRSGRLAGLFGSKIDIFIPIIFFFSFINSLRAALSQYYILEYPDDIVWVSWASKHFNEPLAILLDKQGTGLRPMINLLYAIGYSVWGSNATYYYLMNGVLFAGAMVFLYLLIKQLHSRAAGVIAVFLYLFLDASFILVWKMNYTTSIAEMFFITSSLYYSIHFFEKADKKSLVLAFVLGIFAFLSKEPSILIIPTVNIIYLLHKWKSIEAKTRIASLLVNVSLPLLFLLLTFMVSSEVNAPGTSPLSELIKSRLVTYFELELSTTQGQLKNPYLLFLGCIGTFYFHRFKKEELGGVPINLIKNAISILLIAIVFISSQSLYSLTGAILIVLLLALGFIFGDINRRLGIAWFGVGLAPLLITSQQVQPTYLAEANLGMVLFIGVTVSEYLKYIFSKENSGVKDTQVSSVFKTVNIVIVVLILVLQLSAIPTEISNTNNYQKVVSESQTSFKEAIDYMMTTVPKNGTVYYIPSEEREKVGGSQITEGVFYDVLCMKERCDIKVKNLLPSTNLEKGGFVVLLSNLDAYIFSKEYTSLNNNVYILKQIKNGDGVAYILGVKSA
ncbi:MAG: glycosyltransferase family 39 protein [Candidatus Methanoperedens sp.]|nr:glycosyltransferase family 39 protein [Candidatus Methanoperedens sp.]